MITQTETTCGGISLRDIEAATHAYAIAHADLSDTVRQLEDALRQARASFIKQLRREVAKAADKRAALQGLIELAPELFEKPRTLTFNGIKVGYRKGTGGIEFDDAQTVVARIFNRLGDMGKDYVHTTYKPNKEALLTLDVGTLKKFGCTIRNTGDEVVIKPTNDVDKIVNALLKDATDEAAE